MEEAGLLARARGGDERAFEELLKGSLPKVLGLARRILGDEAEAWDAAQEAFLKAWRGLGEFRGEALFSTWVCGIAARGAIDRIRARKRLGETKEVPEVLASESPGPAEAAVAASLGEAVTRAVARLPEGERSVLVLHEEGGMKYREISERLGIPIGTVMSRLHAARLRLRERLAPWWNEMKETKESRR